MFLSVLRVGTIDYCGYDLRDGAGWPGNERFFRTGPFDLRIVEITPQNHVV